jgi:hypothetical protein
MHYIGLRRSPRRAEGMMRGFSSNIKEKDFSSAAHEVTVGVILR